MRIDNLGVLDGPMLLFGGPYSNLPALEALLAKGRARGVAPSRMICTGDVVAYGASPVACLDLVRDAGMPVVAGNVERQLAAGAGDCGCGFAPGTVCDRLSAGWFAHADRAVGAGHRAWMAKLPDMIRFEQAGRRIAVIHGGVSDISRFLWPVSPEEAFAEELAAIEAASGPVDMVVAGHAGIGFAREVAGAVWINAGVIGMPPNDGGQQTEFVVLEDGAPVFHRLDYDADAAAAQMRAAGLTQGYDAALLSGYWPSEDVLPEALRRGAPASG